MPFLLILGGLLIGAAVIALVWRWLSRTYHLPCPTWFAWFLEGRWADASPLTRSTLDRLGLQPGQRVLEVGPGPGRLLIPAARRVLPGGEVVGLDIQPGMLEKLKNHAARNGVSNLAAVLGDATQPHFPPESFDLVYLCTVLGEIPDRAAALRQCHAVLKPGGVLSITEIIPDPHYQPFPKVKQLAQAAGFELRQVYGLWAYFTANFVKP
jgi:ubiquinone/menaquinone biosynthesis C-methylase UbiE